MSSSWGYVLLCLILPAAWGIISAQIFDRCQMWIARRRHERGEPEGRYSPSPEEPGPDMYHI